MAYYTSETCGFPNGDYMTTGCMNDYAQSDVKYVVDAWKNEKAPVAIEARLTTYEELSAMGEIKINETPSGTYEVFQLQYEWLYNRDYPY